MVILVSIELKTLMILWVLEISVQKIFHDVMDWYIMVGLMLKQERWTAKPNSKS